MLEYEDVLYRESLDPPISHEVIDAVLDFHAAVARQHEIFFLWRPFLRDIKDDLVLELAVKASCNYIVTYNKRDFSGVEKQFSVQVVDPREFLTIIGEMQ